MSGATALAEGGRKFKVDVDLIFNNLKSTDRKYILRTVFDDLGTWKAKYVEVNISPCESKAHNQNKEYAIIDNEVWVFRINATHPADIITAVNIASKHYKVTPDTFLKDVYIKNMNAEQENEMGMEALIKANKSLYTGTCNALREAAKTLAYKGPLRLHIFSNNKNPKMPQIDLHSALTEGGAKKVETDPAKYQYLVSKNDNSQPVDQKPFFTHHHVAVFDI